MSCPFLDLPRLVLHPSILFPSFFLGIVTSGVFSPSPLKAISAMIDDGALRPSMKALNKY